MRVDTAAVLMMLHQPLDHIIWAAQLQVRQVTRITCVYIADYPNNTRRISWVLVRLVDIQAESRTDVADIF